MKKPIGYKPVNYFENKQYALYCADSMRKSGKFNAKVIKENDGFTVYAKLKVKKLDGRWYSDSGYRKAIKRK